MKAPNFLVAWNKRYDVNYDINPWMTDNIKLVNNQKAHQQWLNLVKILKDLGANVSQMSVDNENIPDIVFTANAGFIYNNVLTLSSFKYLQRQYEIPYFRNWFLTNTKTQVNVILETFEGAGDALIDHQGNLWMGHGFRSTLESHWRLQVIYTALNVLSLELMNPEFYHLDTCFCPLSSGHVLYYPDAFSSHDELKILEVFGEKAIQVSLEDASDFACNVVEWDGNLVMNKCSPLLNYELEKIGYSVVETDLTEFLKAGGSAKCLTLKLTSF